MDGRQEIKNWRGKIMGFVYTMDNGDKRATDFSGKTLGFYRAATNLTTDFSGRMIARGDVVVSLIPIDKS